MVDPRTLTAAAVALMLGASPLRAQGADFSLGAGLAVPLGDFDEVNKLGWQITGAAGFAPASLPVAIQVDASFGRFGVDTPLDIKTQVIYGTANAVYRFESADDTRLRPYLIGGLGGYNFKDVGNDALGNSETKFGVNIGAGFDFRAGSSRFFVEGRFHNVFVSGPNIEFFPLNIGVRFGG